MNTREHLREAVVALTDAKMCTLPDHREATARALIAQAHAMIAIAQLLERLVEIPR